MNKISFIGSGNVAFHLSHALKKAGHKIHSISSKNMLHAATLAKEAGNTRAVNMVMVGAASTFLPLPQDSLESAITALFSRKGDKIMAMNIEAFRSGRGS
jgi:indolepyruvate ferredoxin oxidoreductase beta subunit